MKKYIIGLLCALLLIVIILSLSTVFLFPAFFRNSSLIDKKDNQEIKNLILNAIKDRYSILSSGTDNNIYDEQNHEQIVQLYSPVTERSVLCIIDHNFMNSIEPLDETTYQIKFKMYYPVAYYHEFRVQKTQTGYTIIFWGLDI